jgi:uncharacterized protein (DUF2147 family)
MNAVRICLTLTVFLLATSASFADGVLGTWLRDNGNVQVKFEPCGDAVCGNIAWVEARFGFKNQSRAASVLRHAACWRQFLDRQSRQSRQWVNLFRQNVD